jgi:hypothetical protein
MLRTPRPPTNETLASSVERRARPGARGGRRRTSPAGRTSPVPCPVTSLVSVVTITDRTDAMRHQQVSLSSRAGNCISVHFSGGYRIKLPRLTLLFYSLRDGGLEHSSFRHRQAGLWKRRCVCPVSSVGRRGSPDLTQTPPMSLIIRRTEAICPPLRSA